ncbi:MAG: universal stress protein [Terracidiphilus sp.]|jgi:nucleotide-binding universal stress UspA family protein
MPIIGDKADLNLNAIIYATDFSLGAQNAGLYASHLAGYFSATLIVAHAFTLSQAALEVEIDRILVSQQRKDLNTLLENKATQLAGKSSEANSVLLEGDPKDVIPALAEKYQPAMIVLGTHGGGRFERGIIGSTAEKILRSTRWPSLTVGPRVRPASSKTLPFERVLFATDFSAAAAHAALYAVSIAEAFRTKLDILNVIQEGSVAHPDRLSNLQRDFYETLDRLVPELAKEFCDPRSFVEVGKAQERILEHIKEHSIDLLVLGIRKSSHLSIETRTSRAFQIIVDAECPVLTIQH